MMFDNTPPPSPTRWQSAKTHIPMMLIAVGVVALFIGLHTTQILAAIAVGHLALGLLGAAVGRRHQQHRSADS